MRKLIALLCTLLLVGGVSAQEPETEAIRQLQKLNRVYRNLNGLYVDSVDMAPLVEGAIRAMLDKLDPHSAYLTAEEMAREKASMAGEFSGVGVEIRRVMDTLRVMNTIRGGGAEAAGVEPGDRILKIDTLSAVGMEQELLIRQLRGKEGSSVELTLWRPSLGGMITCRVVRSTLPLRAVKAAYLLAPGRGYIAVDRFGRTTMQEFRAAYEALGPLKELVLDLQGNGGGLLQQATEMAAFFLKRGDLIVSTEGYHTGKRRTEASSSGPYRKGRLVVLVDESSASGSEVVAGALQDWDRAILIGRPTYGKGLVQRQVILPDESAVRITIARYHTPSGRVIQRPYQQGDRSTYYAMQLERRLEHTLEEELDTLPAYSTLRYGRRVYGGGGIRPDLVIAPDTAGYSPLYGELVRRQLIHDFVLEEVEHNREKIKEHYPSYEAFRDGYDFEGLYPALLVRARMAGIAFTQEEVDRSKSWILGQLQLWLSQIIFGGEIHARAVNDSGMNPALERAEAVLADWETVSTEVFGVSVK